MPLATGGISQLSPGSGRSFHLMWPEFVSPALSNNGLQRNGSAAVANANANVTQGAPPAATTPVYKGVRCIKINSAVGGAGVALWFTHRINIPRDAMSWPIGLNDRSVVEVRFLCAFDRPAGDLNDARDLGVGISPGTNNQNIFNPAVGAVYRAGTQFGPGGPGKLRFRSRNGQSSVGPPAYSADFDTGNFARAGFDEREWHWYAIRMVGGSVAGAGVCKALLDGVQVSQFSMSTASAMIPDPAGGQGGVPGYQCGFTNATNGEFDGMYIANGSLLIAPDEVSLS